MKRKTVQLNSIKKIKSQRKTLPFINCISAEIYKPSRPAVV